VDTPVLVSYLFGSHAVGRAGPMSDRDIAVLLEPGLTRPERGRWQVELIGRLMDAYHSDAIDAVAEVPRSPGRIAATLTRDVAK
jgi:predicted nucleotidyltransferase